MGAWTRPRWDSAPRSCSSATVADTSSSRIGGSPRSAGGTAVVLLGDGRGHFVEPHRRIALFGGGYSGRQGLGSADFNGDGRPDIAISGDDNGDVFVFLGNGKGRFRPAEGTPEYGGIYPP